MSFPRYPKYKDSGVEWLGEVPEHWQVMPIRYAARLESGHTPSRNHPEYWADCTVPWFTLADVWQIRQARRDVIYETKEKVSELGLANSAARRLPKGTVMLSRTASVGFSAIMGVEMATTQDFANWVCSDHLKPEFLLQVLRSMHGEFSRLMMGSTHNTIYMPDIQALRFALPTMEEQEQIHEFLRSELAKIDALVDEQQRLIELLKEKCQAVISHAVTKGLNPNAPMKPSGVEWLGEVPAHWSVTSVRRVVRRIEQGWSPECLGRPATMDEWGVVKSGCVNRGVFVEQENKALPETLEPIPEYEIRVGDVLMSRASGSPELVGSTAYIFSCRPRLMLSDKIFRIETAPSVDKEFFVLVFNSLAMRAQIERAISGADGLANNLPQSALKEFSLAVPPLSEQKVIVSRLYSEFARINTLITEAQRAIELLQERRAALISAAVTGQIDVRALSNRSTA